MDSLVAAGLGLDYADLRFERTTDAWLVAGAGLRDWVADILRDLPTSVELIGSSSVLGLLAKPIIDLAVGTDSNASNVDVKSRLALAGWIYRGDAGTKGGEVFVLESEPQYRVAHLHIVERDDVQWSNYLRLRDLLRGSAVARDRYEAVKLSLSAQAPMDRETYTLGKTDVITQLLAGMDQSVV